MTSIAVKDEYADVLSQLGDLETTANLAIKKYVIEQITLKIEELRKREQQFQCKYQLNYIEFKEKTESDIDFIQSIETTGNKLWEMDLIDWEFCHEGVKDWLATLQNILTV